MPLISVVIPAYNAEKTILETIESVLNQTFSDLELIVINDGSTDSTLNIVSSIKDPRLKVYSYPNAGVAVSRNRGTAQTCGEFISFIDADDLWTPDKLEAQLKALQANPQAAVAYSWVDYITASGEFFRPGNYITINGNAYQELLIHCVLENGSNPLIRKQALTEVGGFEQELSLAEDWDMWLRLAARYNFVAVPSPQILYRMSAQSASTNILKMEAACLKCIVKAYNQAPASLQHLKKKTLATLYRYLSFKALEAPSGRQSGIIAARCFWNSINNDPSVLWQWQTMLKAFFKITAVLLLPSPQSRELIETFKKVFIKQPSFSQRLDINV
jgi:glycosyltransferase involved in cell wall biosynthesis